MNLPNCGTLADFNNFELPDGKHYDRYKGLAELMPFAKAVSAQTTAFEENGQPKGADFRRLLKIVVDSGYRGYSKSSSPAKAFRRTKASARQENSSKNSGANSVGDAKLGLVDQLRSTPAQQNEHLAF